MLFTLIKRRFLSDCLVYKNQNNLIVLNKYLMDFCNNNSNKQKKNFELVIILLKKKFLILKISKFFKN